MAYLTGLHLKNFKRFEDQVVDLSSDITLLLGPNSSGKSSIIKAILGLKQTVISSNEHEVLATQGDYVDLGTYKDYVFNHEFQRTVTIRVDLNFKDRDSLFFPFSGPAHVGTVLTYDFDYTSAQARILKIELIQLTPEGENLLILLERKKTRNSYKISMPEAACKMVIQHFVRDPMDQDAKGIIEKWQNGLTLYHTERLRFVPHLTKRTEKAHFYLEDLLFTMFDTTLSSVSQVIEREIFYLGPLRMSPSRSYKRTSHSVAVGPLGEHTPSVLANLKNRQIKVTRGQSELRSSYEALNKWVDVIFPGRQVNTETIEELVKLKVSQTTSSAPKKKDNRSDVISDVGFGFSQVFPILVQAAVMPAGSTLIIEQPELHLHPMAQAKLAKVIAAASKMGRRFIIETHSEHFVRGLQLAISEEKAGPGTGITNKAMKVLYVPNAPEEVIHMETDEWGEFTTEWPPGFFDEAYRLAFALLQNKAMAQMQTDNKKTPTVTEKKR